MTQRRGTRRRSRARTPRRPTAWHGDLSDPATVAPGGQTAVNLTQTLLDVDESPLFKQTLTLLRAFITLRINSTDANLSAEGSFGFIMEDGDQTSAAGHPDPDLDVDAPWLYWDRRVFLPPSDSGQHLKIDIRARRKFAGNDVNLFFIMDNDDSTQSLEFALGWRLLLAT